MDKEKTLHLISVIIPVYNAEDTLRACVQSVLKQSYPEFELILVDDGSPDKSGVICDEYTSHANVTIIHQQNKGRTAARYEGVKIAKGEWITFVDADDELEPYALSRFSERIDNETDIIFGNGQSLPIQESETIVILSDILRCSQKVRLAFLGAVFSERNYSPRLFSTYPRS